VMLFQAVMFFVQAYLDQNFTHKGKGLLNVLNLHSKSLSTKSFNIILVG
jgi:hypothetical protein